MKNIMFRTLMIALLIPLLFLVSPSAARAADMTCPPPTPVSIDIKPGNDQNRVKLSSHGVLAVAVLTTPDFDASQFEPAKAGPGQWERIWNWRRTMNAVVSRPQK